MVPCGQDKAAAAAGSENAAAVGAVLPRGARFDASNDHGSRVGNAITRIRTTVADQHQSRRRRRAGIDTQYVSGAGRPLIAGSTFDCYREAVSAGSQRRGREAPGRSGHRGIAQTQAAVIYRDDVARCQSPGHCSAQDRQRVVGHAPAGHVAGDRGDIVGRRRDRRRRRRNAGIDGHDVGGAGRPGIARHVFDAHREVVRGIGEARRGKRPGAAADHPGTKADGTVIHCHALAGTQRTRDGAAQAEGVVVAGAAIDDVAEGRRDVVVGAADVYRRRRDRDIHGDRNAVDAIAADIAGHIGLADLQRAGNIGTRGQRETGARSGSETAAAIDAVLPGGARLQAAYIHRAHAGHAIAAARARIRGQNRHRRRHRATDYRNGRRIAAGCPGVACGIDLPDQHRAWRIAPGRQFEAAARADRETGAAIGAVLPGRPHLDAGDIYRADVGNAVAPACAAVGGECQRRRCRCHRIEGEAADRARDAGVACRIGHGGGHGDGALAECGQVGGGEGHCLHCTVAGQGSGNGPGSSREYGRDGRSAFRIDRQHAGYRCRLGARQVAVPRRAEARCRSSRIYHQRGCDAGCRTDVTCGIALPDLHRARSEAALRQAETGPAAAVPGAAAIAAVLPGGAAFDACDIDGADIGNAVAGALAAVGGKRGNQPRWQHGIQGECPHAATDGVAAGIADRRGHRNRPLAQRHKIGRAERDRLRRAGAGDRFRDGTGGAREYDIDDDAGLGSDADHAAHRSCFGRRQVAVPNRGYGQGRCDGIECEAADTAGRGVAGNVADRGQNSNGAVTQASNLACGE